MPHTQTTYTTCTRHTRHVHTSHAPCAHRGLPRGSPRRQPGVCGWESWWEEWLLVRRWPAPLTPSLPEASWSLAPPRPSPLTRPPRGVSGGWWVCGQLRVGTRWTWLAAAAGRAAGADVSCVLLSSANSARLESQKAGRWVYQLCAYKNAGTLSTWRGALVGLALAGGQGHQGQKALEGSRPWDSLTPRGRSLHEQGAAQLRGPPASHPHKPWKGRGPSTL